MHPLIDFFPVLKVSGGENARGGDILCSCFKSRKMKKKILKVRKNRREDKVR